MSGNPVQAQIRLFALLAGLSALASIMSARAGDELLLALSLAFLLASPYIAYVIVLFLTRRDG